MARALEFVLVTEERAEEFGAAFADIIANNPRILRDFPQLAGRYDTPEQAANSLRQACQGMAKQHGSFGVYAVVLNGRVVGCGSYLQRVQWTLLKPAAEGPLVALWLDDRRTDDEKGLLSDILRLAAREIAARARVTSSDLHGHVYTFVRPDHTVVLDALGDPENGFGGFQVIGGPKAYSNIDGVHDPRLLCRAQQSVGDLVGMLK